MPNPDNTLFALAKGRVPNDPEVRDCWRLVLSGVELGWLDGQEIRELLEHLRSHRDFGVEELLCANVGDRLRVSFLGDAVECSPAEMIQELAALIEQ